jgi:hypothetical protein
VSLGAPEALGAGAGPGWAASGIGRPP